MAGLTDTYAAILSLPNPFAFQNFGDANLAPWTWWDVVAREEMENRAKRFYSFGQGVEVLRRGGIEFLDAGKLCAWAQDRFGLDGLPEFKITEPVKEKPAAAGEAGTPPGAAKGGGSQ